MVEQTRSRQLLRLQYLSTDRSKKGELDIQPSLKPRVTSPSPCWSKCLCISSTTCAPSNAPLLDGSLIATPNSRTSRSKRSRSPSPCILLRASTSTTCRSSTLSRRTPNAEHTSITPIRPSHTIFMTSSRARKMAMGDLASEDERSATISMRKIRWPLPGMDVPRQRSDNVPPFMPRSLPLQSRNMYDDWERTLMAEITSS